MKNVKSKSAVAAKSTKKVATPPTVTPESITKNVDRRVKGSDEDDNYVSFTTRDKLIMGGFRTKILRAICDVAVECRKQLQPTPVVNNEFIRQRAEKLYPDEEITPQRIKRCVNRLAQMGILDKGYLKGEEAYKLSGKVIQSLMESKYNTKVALKSLTNTF